MPADFDPQFWNAAPGALQLRHGLRGREVIAVVMLSYQILEPRKFGMRGVSWS